MSTRRSSSARINPAATTDASTVVAPRIDDWVIATAAAPSSAVAP